MGMEPGSRRAGERERGRAGGNERRREKLRKQEKTEQKEVWKKEMRPPGRKGPHACLNEVTPCQVMRRGGMVLTKEHVRCLRP